MKGTKMKKVTYTEGLVLDLFNVLLLQKENTKEKSNFPFCSM